MSRTLGFENEEAPMVAGSLYHATPFVEEVMETGLVPPAVDDPLLVSSGEIVMRAKEIADTARLEKAKRDGHAFPDATFSLHPQDLYDWRKIFAPESPRGVFLGNRSTVQNAYVQSSAPLGERTNMILDMLASSRAVLNETGDTRRAKEAEELIAEYLGNAGISLNNLPKNIRVGVVAVDPRAKAVREAVSEAGLYLLEDSGDYEPMPPRGLEVREPIDPRFIKELSTTKLVPIGDTRLGGLLDISPYDEYARLSINLPK